MPVPILNSLLLVAEAALYFSVMAALLRLRHQMGVGLFMSALGVMHFIETYLASSFYVELPFGILSPGSTVLFSGKLIMLLFLYMKEDAATVRQPIYGLLIGNFLVLGLVGLLSFHHVALLPSGRSPDIAFVQEMGWLMVWGTALLYIDALAIILCYEKLRRWFGQALFTRILISAAVVLTFDQVGFYIVLHILTDAPLSVLFGGWAAKMCAAIIYSGAIIAYLRWVEPPRVASPQPISDLFQVLTYREKYEQLVEDSGRDGLTRLLHRGRFEAIAGQMLKQQRQDRQPISLLMIDIDHFKSINDSYGHSEGDRVLCAVAALLVEHTGTPERHAFRLGGEEFAVLAPIPHSLAWLLAENIRLAVAGSFDGQDKALTVSVGVATATPGRDTVAELYSEADRRLYLAKSQGRNRAMGELLSPTPSLRSSG